MVFGGDGDDLIRGGTGDDVLVGGAGKDALHASQGRDLVVGGSGGDHLKGGDDDDLSIATSSSAGDLSTYEAALTTWLNEDLDGALASLGDLISDQDVDDLHGKKVRIHSSATRKTN